MASCLLTAVRPALLRKVHRYTAANFDAELAQIPRDLNNEEVSERR